ncbi:MAG: O-antigen ligase family protein [Proteobacteria bacterium]|nr:O-antigen ligase family protein [Pseudomonadota bacterium]
MTVAPLAALRSRIPRINEALFAASFFFLPGHVAPVYTLSAIMLVLSVLEGRFREKWALLRSDSLFWIFQAFFWLFPLALLWTEDMAEGRRMVGRYTFFLLSPLYLTIARRELLARCIAAFLAGCLLAEGLAYYNWLQMHVFPAWPAGLRVAKDPADTAPFVDHILYAPILAWAAYLAARASLSGPLVRRLGYALLTALSAGNLLFSGGRAGQLVFLVLLAVLVFQRFARRPLLAGLLSAALVSALLAGAYAGNDYFRSRVDMAVDEITHYEDSVNTSAALRLTFLMNSARLFAEHPLVGVGSGDYTREYAKLHERYSAGWLTTDNPHNQYLFVLTTTGLLGGAVLFAVYFPPLLWRGRCDDVAPLRTALVVFICTSSLFEDYLWRSNTSLLFVLFAVLLLGARSRDMQSSVLR